MSLNLLEKFGQWFWGTLYIVGSCHRHAARILCIPSPVARDFPIFVKYVRRCLAVHYHGDARERATLTTHISN